MSFDKKIDLTAGVYLFSDIMYMRYRSIVTGLTISTTMLSSVHNMASEAKQMVASFQIAPPLGASLRLQSANTGKKKCDRIK